jgi:hypothetical protein
MPQNCENLGCVHIEVPFGCLRACTHSCRPE